MRWVIACMNLLCESVPRALLVSTAGVTGVPRTGPLEAMRKRKRSVLAC